MKSTGFRSLSEKKKKEMRHVIEVWQRRQLPVSLLEEGLRILSEEKRPTANELTKEDGGVADFACVWGKWTRPKLALTKEDAMLLLELVTGIRKVAFNDELAKDMVGIASSVLLDGKRLPARFTDPAMEPLRGILRGFDPTVNQSALF